MKNILFFQTDEDEKVSESEPDADQTTTSVTLDKELQKKLVDSEEIVLYTKRSSLTKTTPSNVQFLEKTSEPVAMNELAELSIDAPTINNLVILKK